MSHLPILSLVVFALSVLAAVKLLERAADQLSVEDREVLRQNIRLSSSDFLLALAPIAVGYVLLQQFPAFAGIIVSATIVLVAATQVLGYLRGMRKVRTIGLPAHYVAAYRTHYIILNFGFVVFLAAQAWRFFSAL